MLGQGLGGIILLFHPFQGEKWQSFEKPPFQRRSINSTQRLMGSRKLVNV